EPTVDRPSQLRLAAQPSRERDLGEVDPEAAPELGERAELVQLPQAVAAVAGVRTIRNDEADPLEVAEHAGRPARAGSGLGDLGSIHSGNPNTSVSRLVRARSSVLVL